MPDGGLAPMGFQGYAIGIMRLQDSFVVIAVLGLGVSVAASSLAELRDTAGFDSTVQAPDAPATRPVGEEPDDWGLYFRGRKISADEWKMHKEALDALTDMFLAEVRPPIILPAGAVMVTGTDDLAYGADRGGKLDVQLTPKERSVLNVAFRVPLPHEAIDVASRISFDGGKTLTTIADSAVYPIFPRGAVTSRRDGLYVAQKVELRGGPYCLILDIVYAHVAPGIGPFRTDRSLGVLAGDNHWLASDRALFPLLNYKGNHLHLLVRGINDLENRHYAELARPGACCTNHLMS